MSSQLQRRNKVDTLQQLQVYILSFNRSFHSELIDVCFSEYVRDMQKMVLSVCDNKDALEALDKLKPKPDSMTSRLDHGTREEAITRYERRRAMVKCVLQNTKISITKLYLIS